jgi:hypothetical protein
VHSAKKRAQNIAITDNGWESKFWVETTQSYYDSWAGEYVQEATVTTYPPVKVDRIFRNSDLAMQVSLKLGPNFFPFTKWERIDEACDESDHGYSVYKKTLWVRYYPFGVTQQQMTRLLAVAKTQAERMAMGKVIGLTAGEECQGHKELNIVPPAAEDDYADMPPLVSAGARSTMPSFKSVVMGWNPDGDRCFCGCSADL